ncbi:MAG: DNA-formamidopyrimidine glycosylase [Peptococcaceae bacterium]|jgi:formamidopyrimidine-DNA glycosylase|nr:DNA-formamidopyrimidine glycosylase [Peptococcaceae bacterium]
MPELPEVETVRRTLEPAICGQCIRGVQVFWEKTLVPWPETPYADVLNNAFIQSIGRRGKYLLINLEPNWTLLAHLRMTGQFVYYPEPRAADTHTRVIFALTRGELHFHDTRKFGRIQLLPTDQTTVCPSLAKLGPEPFSPEFTRQYLQHALAKCKNGKLKPLLLSQAIVVGLGNIYVDEALFRAKIRPERIAAQLDEAEARALHAAIIDVLTAGIEHCGTTFRDFRTANGEKGGFQDMLQVYGRAGEACRCCGRTLEKLRLGGRTSVYCAHCQR